jgi:hypothetical protein
MEVWMSSPGSARSLGEAEGRIAETTATTNLDRVAWTELDTYSTPVRGSLTVVESGHGIPFVLRRIFYIYGTTMNCERGAHAHRETCQGFIAIRGCFSLDLTDSRQSRSYELSEPNRVLYVPPMIWARVYNFSHDAICLVLADSLYDAADYVREWDEYVKLIANREDARL